MPVATITKGSDGEIVCNRSKASRLSFVVPEPVKVITFGMVVLSFSANKVTCEVLFVRMIGVRPESTTLQISFTMRSFRKVSSESDWYIAVMVCLSSVIDRYDVNLGIRYLSKDCLAIWLFASAENRIGPHCMKMIGC